MLRFRRLLSLALLCLLLPACAERAEQGPVVLAAASLQEAMSEVGEAWTAGGHPPPVLAFAGSATHARQLQRGAPADLFVSADERWMDRLADDGLLRPGTRATLLAGRLVLIAPAEAPDRVALNRADLREALGASRLAIADTRSVPAGRYAREALTRLGLWPAVADRLAQTDSVRAALALVESGEARLGLVYATDAAASRGVAVVARIPQHAHTPIRYPVAVLAGSTHPDAEAFTRYLATPRARAIFARHGFAMP